MHLRLWAVCISILLLAACAVGPDYVPPQPPLSAGYAQGSGVSMQDPAVADAALTAWWRPLGDATLDGLMERAAFSNREVAAATARLAQARALRGAAAGGFWPEGGPHAGYSRVRTADTVNPAVAMGIAPRTMDLYQAGFDASWEIDLFGAVRRNVQAAGADTQAAEASLADAVSSVQAEVARNYAELRWGLARMDIARQDVIARQRSAQANAARFRAGMIPQVDALRAQAELDAARARIPALEQEAKAAMHRLAVLIGQPPAQLAVELWPAYPAPDDQEDLATVSCPTPPGIDALPNVPLMLPADMARRRPDIRAAERRLEAATARVGVAVADLFPRVSISGSYARQATSLNDLDADGAESYAFGPSLRWNILNLKRLLARVDASEASRDEALARYEQTVLTALREVEDSLAGLDAERRRTRNLADAAGVSRTAVTMAEERYAAGLSTYVELAAAQSTLLAAQDSLAMSKRNAVITYIALVKALGGASPVQ